MGHMGGPMGGFGMMQREMLKNVDTNGDGALSQDEINAAVNARFAEFDADKNGSLSLSEFEALWAEITKPMAVRAFQFLDPNGDAGDLQGRARRPLRQPRQPLRPERRRHALARRSYAARPRR